MRYLYQALYALTLISAGAAGSYVWLRQVQPQLAPHAGLLVPGAPRRDAARLFLVPR